jgi:HSP20 family protein
MLTKYRITNDWPSLSPFGLFEEAFTWPTIDTLRTDLARLLGTFERVSSGASTELAEISGSSAAQLHDAGTQFVITVDLPGVAKKDVELSITGDNVFVRASRDLNVPEGYTAHRRERSSYNFENAYKLPAPVDSSKAEATLKNGVLTVTLPKSPSAQPMQIQVKAS